VPRFVTHLESAIDGSILAADQLASVHQERPLWVRYDLAAIGRAVDRDALRQRPRDLWRYRELLPTGDLVEPVSLGETMTPLVECPALAHELGLARLAVKDESRLPTGSFKSRGLAMAVTMARHFGVSRVAIPTAGNAGCAMAAYATRAGIESFVLMPADTPQSMQLAAHLAGAHVVLVNGLISDCGRLVRDGAAAMGWFDMSTLREPYRIEGKKTMGLELAEDGGWTLPDVIVYPTGGGTGLIGMWKAFGELKTLGWLDRPTLPRMVAVQSSGCQPIVRAHGEGARFATPFAGAQTIAYGLRVPAALGDFMILDAIRASGGTAIATPEDELPKWQARIGALEGLGVSLETAAALGALPRLVKSRVIGPADRVVVFSTAGPLQSGVPPLPQFPRVDPAQPVNWRRLQDELERDR